MKKAGFLLALAVLMTAGFSYGTYVLSFNYNNGEISLKGVEFKPETFAPMQKNLYSGDYYGYELWSHEGVLLDVVLFEVPRNFFYDHYEVDEETGEEATAGGMISLDNVDFDVITWYYPEGAEIMIYNSSNETVIKQDISMLSQCNQNSVCEEGESVMNCIYDCPEQPEESANGKEQKIKKEDIKAGFNSLDIIFAVLLASLVIITAMFKKRRKRVR